METEINFKTLKNPYDHPTSLLSKSIVKRIEPSLLSSKNHLQELRDKQETLIEDIHKENLKLSEVQYNSDLNDMFNKMKLYHSKLLDIKKDMKHLHERSTKLKRRALKIEQVKVKEVIINKTTDDTVDSGKCGPSSS